MNSVETKQPRREVFCADALLWLSEQGVVPNASFVASLPDYSEFPSLSLSDWKEWFTEAAKKVLKATPDEGVTIFFQSDIKHEGAWIDKAYLCQRAAEAHGADLLWHKIVCRAPAGQVTFGRPGYSHILCFSRSLRLTPAQSSADVIPEAGEKLWERGMGIKAAAHIATFLREHTSSKTLVNPFCGKGSVLAVANAFGLDAVGIERSPKRAEAARMLSVSLEAERWILPSATPPQTPSPKAF